MNEGKLLKFIISFLVLLQVLGFVFQVSSLYKISVPLLFIAIASKYILESKKIKPINILVLFLFFASELTQSISGIISIKHRMLISIVGYLMLFYFLYNNHKSFRYNRRDVFTLVLGSSLYTVIFFITYSVIREPMQDLNVIGFVHLLLLYVLLIVGAMHYINIRSEKSLWFFLAMLNFSFSDFILLIDEFYLQSMELKAIRLICEPLALIFLVNYMITKYEYLKSEEFEGF
ncbi:hypothetical protein SAMN04487910_4166 [Aquimarina amphilecti]|uniref:YhhN-like protein n=1 Tax=Aquimarina amphilecti TaxID=1038014 RepID=A0A1H7VSF4_AQUAM|nr:hypothetical protein [Aquimarina amphilecti]SEM11974.1 hypothetical protein SAMN04487910_4166 [Aquimarina amphilecti]